MVILTEDAQRGEHPGSDGGGEVRIQRRCCLNPATVSAKPPQLVDNTLANFRMIVSLSGGPKLIDQFRSLIIISMNQSVQNLLGRVCGLSHGCMVSDGIDQKS